MATKPDSYFDVRTVERNIARGKLTKKEYEAYLKNLPDVEDKGVPMLWDEEEAEEDVSESEENV